MANEPEYFEAVGVTAFRAGAAVEALAGTSTVDVANRADAEIARTERLRMRMSLVSLATHPSDGPTDPTLGTGPSGFEPSARVGQPSTVSRGSLDNP